MITKEWLHEIGGWQAAKEGKLLAEKGAVSSVAYAEGQLTGIVSVHGNSIRSRLRIGRSLADTENLCPCRQSKQLGQICPHVLALGFELLSGPRPKSPALPEPPRTTLKTQAQPSPRLFRVPLDDAGPSSAPLELSLLLPLDLPKSWASGAIRILLEGSISGSLAKPLDAVPLRPATPYSVTDADERLLLAVESRNAGTAPGMWMLRQADADKFFRELLGHPRIWIGKRQQIVLALDPARPSIRIRFQPNGTAQIRVDCSPSADGQIVGNWRFDGRHLVRTAALPDSLAQGRELTIGRETLPQLLRTELPTWRREAEIEFEGAQPRFEVAIPRIRARIDGDLGTLSARLDALYADEPFALIEGAPEEAGWIADTRDPLRFFSRNAERERQALRELRSAGFEPSRSQPDVFVIQSEHRIAPFLANVLPKWQKQWDVTFGKRADELLRRCEVLIPEAEISGSREDWFSIDVRLRSAAGTELTLAEASQLLAKGSSHCRLANGKIGLVPTRAVAELQETVFDCGVQQEPGGRMEVGARHAGYLNAALKDAGWQVAAQPGWNPPAALRAPQDFPLPESLQSILRPYQGDGVRWLAHLASNGLGGILADDMGLGKTLQTLALLACRDRGQPSLVVCPTSLVGNWLAEARRFVPQLRTVAITGSERSEQLARINSADLAITSYALLRRDLEAYSRLELDMVILDEAQNIKNRFSQSAQAVKSLRARARTVLTGTPIENSLFDLWSIFDFLMPGYLGPAPEFKERYEVPITKLRDEGALRRLRQRLGPFVLRRTKDQVAPELPPRIDQTIACALTAEQQGVYQSLLEQGRREAFEAAGEKGKSSSRIKVLTALTRLRQACCHLDLLPKLEGRTWNEPSAKLDACLELLDEAIKGGHRVLVFSQFTSMLRILADALRERAIEFCYLDGQTQNREAEILKFQEGSTVPIFLISLKAGGTGLNLTGADCVVQFDPWWNPAVEDQAAARAHRIGQTRAVTNYKLIAQGTVEEKIVGLQARKRELADPFLNRDDEAFVGSLTMDELRSLFE